jgi:methylated-DNA-[protein]-cysteine S-methyltransferase
MTADCYFKTRCGTPLGELTLVVSDSGLRAVLWPNDNPERVPLPPHIVAADSYPVLEAARRQLAEYFAGRRASFDIPLDLRGTDFQRSAWLSLAAIPYGTTATYAEQAARIGRPKAVRAMGAANGRNPLSIILPCHRVVGSGGGLVGYAAGIDAKRWLLEYERANAHSIARVSRSLR